MFKKIILGLSVLTLTNIPTRASESQPVKNIALKAALDGIPIGSASAALSFALLSCGSFQQNMKLFLGCSFAGGIGGMLTAGSNCLLFARGKHSLSTDEGWNFLDRARRTACLTGIILGCGALSLHNTMDMKIFNV